MSYQWIQVDYKDGWLGFRVEPEDQGRADAIKALIPPAERKYLSNQRKWIIKPKWAATMVNILSNFCQDYPVILEERHADLLRTLLVGPNVLQRPEGQGPQQPDGVHVGTLSDLQR